ncbi:MAG TPA: hypothetical protein VMT52_10425, partial [Planctomycetota bacterium]|nr:hypothetical protein [Planctomycetota bacterium]
PRPAGDLAIARISVLPSRARALEEAVLAALGGDAQPRGELALDALSGLLVTRCSGPESALERAIPLLSGAARALDGLGALVYLPPSIRAAHPYLLAPSPNASLARSLLRALDPAGIFSPGRILGSG